MEYNRLIERIREVVTELRGLEHKVRRLEQRIESSRGNHLLRLKRELREVRSHIHEIEETAGASSLEVRHSLPGS